MSMVSASPDRKSTRLNSSHTVIYTLSLHDALPISNVLAAAAVLRPRVTRVQRAVERGARIGDEHGERIARSEEHTSELQSHRDLHSFPTRRSSDLQCPCGCRRPPPAGHSRATRSRTGSAHW